MGNFCLLLLFREQSSTYINQERLATPSGQGASSKTVRKYGETMQRRHEGVARRST